MSHGSNNSYLPTREPELDPWLINFSTLIQANPTSYGVQVSDATAIAAAVDAWHDAFLTATNPTTRTRATIEAKNVQKSNVLSVVRGYAATIRANRGVSNALKVGLGLHIPDAEPSPVPPPSTYPVLTVGSFNLGTLTLNAADQLAPERKAKPAGTAGLLLFSTIGPEPVSTPQGAEFNAFLTRTRYVNTYNPQSGPLYATFFGRWTNGKGELGPWSPPVSIRLAA